MKRGRTRTHVVSLYVCVCAFGGHTPAETRGSGLDSHVPSGKDTVPLSAPLSASFRSVQSALM